MLRQVCGYISLSSRTERYLVLSHVWGVNGWCVCSCACITCVWRLFRYFQISVEMKTVNMNANIAITLLPPCCTMCSHHAAPCPPHVLPPCCTMCFPHAAPCQFRSCWLFPALSQLRMPPRQHAAILQLSVSLSLSTPLPLYLPLPLSLYLSLIHCIFESLCSRYTPENTHSLIHVYLVSVFSFYQTHRTIQSWQNYNIKKSWRHVFCFLTKTI